MHQICSRMQPGLMQGAPESTATVQRHIESHLHTHPVHRSWHSSQHAHLGRPFAEAGGNVPCSSPATKRLVSSAVQAPSLARLALCGGLRGGAAAWGGEAPVPAAASQPRYTLATRRRHSNGAESLPTPWQQEHSRLTWGLQAARPLLQRRLHGLPRCRPGAWHAAGGCERLVVCRCWHRGRQQRQPLLRALRRGSDIDVLLPRPGLLGLQPARAIARCLHECTRNTLHTILLCLQ